MILAIDCGNSQIVIGCIDKDGTISNIFRMESRPRKTAFEYAADIHQVIRLLRMDVLPLEGAVLSCVVPSLRNTLQEAARLITGGKVLVIGAGIRTGIRIRIDDPGTVAPDLVSTAVAANALFPCPCIIIELGTATAVTALDENGDYIGGAFIPGVNISLDALSSRASLLPSVEIAPPKKVIGTSTQDSMKSGIIYGSAGALDGMIDRFSEELGSVKSIVATGTLAGLICPFCKHEITISENLIFHGLWRLWNNNRKYIS